MWYPVKRSFVLMLVLGLSIFEFVAVCADTHDPEFTFAEDPPPMSSNSTCSDWILWKPPVTKPAVIMQVVSRTFIGRTVNFIHVMERNTGFTRNNMFLVCLDQESWNFFAKSSLAIRCVPFIHEVPRTDVDRVIFRKMVWKTRVNMLRCFLVVGAVDVILSDADALWIEDLRQVLYPSPGHESIAGPSITFSSVIASRGDYPWKENLKWGSTMCMGFAVFKVVNLPAMKKFADTMESIAMSLGDDQVAVNRAADVLGIAWNEGSDMRFTESVTEAVGTIESLPLDEEGRPFTVTMVPHRTFVRKCSTPTVIPEDTIVIHCHDRKLKWMAEVDLWVINRNINHEHDP